MMEFIVAATAAVSAGGQILGGIGEKKSADLNAFNIETDKKLNKVQAMQESEARRADYDLATASNIAAFADGQSAKRQQCASFS